MFVNISQLDPCFELQLGIARSSDLVDLLGTKRMKLVGLWRFA